MSENDAAALRSNGVPRRPALYDRAEACGAARPNGNVSYEEHYWDGSSQTGGPDDCELPAGHTGEHQASWRTGPPGHRESEFVFWD
jgi:hypothetical protein